MTFAALTCSMVMVFGVTGSAWAASSNSGLDRLTTLNPGISSDSLKQSVEQYALDSDQTFEAALGEILDAADLSIIESAPVESQKGSSTQSSPGGGTHQIGAASFAGDVFYTPAYSGPVNHGHSGIFHNKTQIVEAPGVNQVSRVISVFGYTVASGSQKQVVTGSEAEGSAASQYARTNYVGIPYNSNFSYNKYLTGNMNCSQLVWAAWRATSGIDIDGNGGPGVYPFNIRDSPNTFTYQTF